jgi:MFS family permease
MTVQGVGAALSPAIGGWLAQELGYPAAFTILGCFAIGSIAIWLSFASVLKPACAGKRTSDIAAVPVRAY